MTLLQIGAHDTRVIAGSGDRPEGMLTLALGAGRTSAAFFRGDLPTPLELETAIETVEHEVSRARGLTGDASVLVSSDAALHALAAAADPLAAPGSAPRSITLAGVEALFQRLASAALGHPTALRGMPTGREAAAVLLIVREFMHHLGFESLVLVDGPAPGAEAGEDGRDEGDRSAPA